jgi:hypothetical protein
VDKNKRPDLSTNQLASLATIAVAVFGLALAWPQIPAPGSALGQSSAAIGVLLLLAPLGFVIMKRSGMSASPPSWFVAHVLFSVLGACLIFIHVAAGDWLSPPGVVLAMLVFLVLQGSLMRALIARGFSLLFARSSVPQGFHAPAGLDRNALQAVIDEKTDLLRQLDPGASEALFSPALKHWLGKPLQSCHYQWLAEREARMVGARADAGRGLAWARRIHLLIAAGFYLGLIAHVIVVLFFAGYAAGGDTIDWWHITAWGGP